MAFGKSVSTSPVRITKTVLPRPYLRLELFCEGGSTPNPGVGQPVVHDGSTFLKVPPVANSANNRAVYAAVHFALEHAEQVGATDVVITLASQFVWAQIAQGAPYVKLKAELERCIELADRIPQVTWVLIRPPIVVGSRTVGSRRALRRLAVRTRAQASVMPAPASIPMPTPVAAGVKQPVAAPQSLAVSLKQPVAAQPSGTTTTEAPDAV